MWPFMFLTYVRPWGHFFSRYFAAFVSFTSSYTVKLEIMQSNFDLTFDHFFLG